MVPLPTPSPVDAALYPPGTAVESAGSAVAWTAIWAGTTIAIAIWLVLLTLGAGLSFADEAAWPGMRSNGGPFQILAGLWLIVSQWLSFTMGGYVAGRLRVRWVRLHDDEVFFRDTAHGLLTWALATVVVTGLAVLVSSLTINVPIDPSPVNPADFTPDMTMALQKAASATAFFTALAMIIGAFSASVAAVIGGRLRDRHP